MDESSSSEEPLILLATQNGDEGKALDLINAGHSVNVTDGRGNCALHECAKHDLAKIASALITAGAAIDQENADRNTPLHIACEKNSEKMVQLLLEHNCNVNAPNYRARTPLHFACDYSKEQVVSLLINAGANLDAPDDQNFTPLCFAIRSKNTEVVQLMLDKGCDITCRNITGHSFLQQACTHGNFEIFMMVLDKFGTFNKNEQDPDGNTLLMLATRYSKYEIVKQLIDFGADTTIDNMEGLIAIHFAARCQDGRCFELVLQHTPFPVIEKFSTLNGENWSGQSLPCILIERNKKRELRILVESGISEGVLTCPTEMDTGLVSPLAYLFFLGNAVDPVDMYDYLDLYGSDKNLLDPYYGPSDPSVRTIEAIIWYHYGDDLHKGACFCGQYIFLLLEAGVNPDIPLFQNSNIPRPLTLSLECGFIQALTLLLSYSQTVTPEDLLDDYLHYIATPNYRWTGHEEVIVDFLAPGCSHFDHNTRQSILEMSKTAAVENRPTFARIHQTLEQHKFPTLKSIARFWFRSNLRQNTNGIAKFRKVLHQLELPECLKQYLILNEM